MRLLVGQRGAQWGNHFLNAGQHQANGVEIAFHHDRPTGAPHRLLGGVHVVQGLSLLKDHRFRAVQVLRRIVPERTSPEADVSAEFVQNRKHQASPKTRSRLGLTLTHHE